MDLNDIRELKRKTESDVADLIKEFERRTGTNVEYIEIEKLDSVSGIPLFYEIKLKVKI